MTRQEAKASKVKYLNSDDKWSTSIIPALDCHELLDTIYDDFESRTCSNCTSFRWDGIKNHYGHCSNYIIMYHFDRTNDRNAVPISHDFGCNQFKRK